MLRRRLRSERRRPRRGTLPNASWCFELEIDGAVYGVERESCGWCEKEKVEGDEVWVSTILKYPQNLEELEGASRSGYHMISHPVNMISNPEFARVLQLGIRSESVAKAGGITMFLQ